MPREPIPRNIPNHLSSYSRMNNPIQQFPLFLIVEDYLSQSCAVYGARSIFKEYVGAECGHYLGMGGSSWEDDTTGQEVGVDNGDALGC